MINAAFVTLLFSCTTIYPTSSAASTQQALRGSEPHREKVWGRPLTCGDQSIIMRAVSFGASPTGPFYKYRREQGC